jgi:PAS domain S-box-containing protein
MERMFGYQRGELVGRLVDTLVPAQFRSAHARDRAGYEAEPQMRAMGRGRDLTAIRKDGTEFPVEIGLSPVRSEGGFVVAAHVTDISARTEAVETLRRARDQFEQQVLERTAELRAANAALSELSRRLLTLQDEERRRIGKELHEGTAQSLTGVAINLALVERSAKRLGKRAQAALAQCHILVDQSSRELRTLSYLLHPPLLDEVGLASAVRWYAAGFAQHSGLVVDFSVSPDLGRLPQDIETGLFRILEGCLSNLHSDGHGSSVCVEVQRAPDAVTLKVEDRGSRMSPGRSRPPAGDTPIAVWILGMQERARELGGQLDIVPSESGVVTIATLPLRES